jgi:hypothetical protein
MSNLYVSQEKNADMVLIEYRLLLSHKLPLKRRKSLRALETMIYRQNLPSRSLKSWSQPKLRK